MAAKGRMQKACGSNQMAMADLAQKRQANWVSESTKVPTERPRPQQQYPDRSPPEIARLCLARAHQEVPQPGGNDPLPLVQDGDVALAHAKLCAVFAQREMLPRSPQSRRRYRRTSRANHEVRRRVSLLQAKLVLLGLSMLLFLERAIYKLRRSCLFPHQAPIKKEDET